MAPPKKIKGTTAIFTLRTDAKQLSVASAIAALRREAISDVLRRAIDSYIHEYGMLLGQTAKGLQNDDNDLPYDSVLSYTPETPGPKTRARCLAAEKAAILEKVVMQVKE
jgi:hypothetical protein